jgi:hypothetical protein
MSDEQLAFYHLGASLAVGLLIGVETKEMSASPV